MTLKRGRELALDKKERTKRRETKIKHDQEFIRLTMNKPFNLIVNDTVHYYTNILAKWMSWLRVLPG